jgi:hypothetical protein
MSYLAGYLISWGFAPIPTSFLCLGCKETEAKKNQVKINLSVFSMLRLSPTDGILTSPQYVNHIILIQYGLLDL